MAIEANSVNIWFQLSGFKKIILGLAGDSVSTFFLKCCSFPVVAVDGSAFRIIILMNSNLLNSLSISVVVLCSLKFIHANQLFYRYDDVLNNHCED